MILAAGLAIAVIAGLFANNFKEWIVLMVLMAAIAAGMAHLGGLI